MRPLLNELARAHLIVEHVPGRYTFHDLLRAYAADLTYRTDTDQQRHTAIHRMLDHYLHTAHTADRLIYPALDRITLTAPQSEVTPETPADHDTAMAWFTVEHPVLLAAIDHATISGFDIHAWQLACTLATFLDRRGHWYDYATTQQAALAAARRLADPTAQVHAHRGLARAYTPLGRVDDADTHLRCALDLYCMAGDQAGQARIQLNFAMVRERQGSYTEALDHARKALDLFQATGHQQGQANALNAVGWFDAQLGNYRQAFTYCQQALTLFQQIGDRVGQAGTWDSLGYAHHHLGHQPQAITCYQTALHMYRDLGDRYYEADTLNHLGDTHHTTGNHTAARDAWQLALTILDQLDQPNADEVRTKLHQP